MLTVRQKIKKIILLIGDLSVFELALLLTPILRYGDWSPSLTQLHFRPFAILFLTWCVSFYVLGLYDFTIEKQNGLKNLRLYVEAMLVNLVLGVMFFYLIPIFGITPRTNLVLLFAVSLCLGYGWRVFFNHIILPRLSKDHALFIGPNNQIDEIKSLIETNSPNIQLRAMITTDEELPRVLDTKLNVSKNISELEQFIRKEQLSLIVLGVKPEEHPEIRKQLYKTLFHHVTLMDRAELEEITTGRIPLSYVNETWFLHHLREAEKTWYEFIKRGFDLLLTIPLGLIALLITPIAALGIKLSSKGPIMVKMTRVGKQGKPFTLVKFRSMHATSAGGLSETNGAQFTANAKTDPRLFIFGRFLRQTRIDELPQVWNIIKGDLSLIGPRPERPEFVKPLIEQMPYYALRHLTRPGLTGWAQVKYLTPVANLEDNLTKLQYDLYYIKHRSFALDFSILLKTVGIVLRRQGT